jgi:hypothetical protein
MNFVKDFAAAISPRLCTRDMTIVVMGAADFVMPRRRVDIAVSHSVVPGLATRRSQITARALVIANVAARHKLSHFSAEIEKGHFE